MTLLSQGPSQEPASRKEKSSLGLSRRAAFPNSFGRGNRAMEPRKSNHGSTDMFLTASLEHLDYLDALARQLCADVVITSKSDAFSKMMKETLQLSRPILFVMGANGRQVAQYALLLDQTTVENLCLSNLVDAVRAAAKARNQSIMENKEVDHVG